MEGKYDAKERRMAFDGCKLTKVVRGRTERGLRIFGELTQLGLLRKSAKRTMRREGLDPPTNGTGVRHAANCAIPPI